MGSPRAPALPGHPLLWREGRRQREPAAGSERSAAVTLSATPVAARCRCSTGWRGQPPAWDCRTWLAVFRFSLPDTEARECIADLQVDTQEEVDGTTLCNLLDTVRERERREERKCPHEVVTGVCERLQRRTQSLKISDQIVLGLREDVGSHRSESIHLSEHLRQLRTLLVENLCRNGEFLENLPDLLVLIVDASREHIQAVERACDVVTLLVESTDECVRLLQKTSRLAFATVERGTEFFDDGLQLAHTAAVEQQRQCAENLLDLRGVASAIQRNEVTVGQLRRVRSGRRGRQLDELLAEQVGLLDRGNCVGGQINRRVEDDAHVRGPSVRSDRHVVDATDGNAVDLHSGLRNQVEHVVELNGQVHRIGTHIRTAGKRDSVDPLGRAGGCRDQDGAQSGATINERFTRPPRFHWSVAVTRRRAQCPELPASVVRNRQGCRREGSGLQPDWLRRSSPRRLRTGR